MAQAAVEVGITAADGGVAVRAYTQLLRHVLVMLEEIDRLAVPGDVARPEWAIRSAVTVSDEFRVILLPRTLPKQRDPDSLSIPPLALVDGVRSLADAPEIPRLFSEPVVSHVDQLGHQIGRRGITGVTMTSVNGQRSSGAAVTEAVRQNARRAVEPVSAAWSSVVGVLDVISARREKRRIGLLTSEGRAVVCNVQQLPNDLVFEAFEKKVVAAGILRRNGRGQAVSLDAESLEILPTEQRVTARDLLGAAPDVTGPLTINEFMAVIRDR